jgi:hypothetical protein
MTTTKYHLAQINVGKLLAPLDDPMIAGFVNALDEINALADRSAGFVWRFQTEEGDATALRPFDDDLILVNFSVWESAEALKNYVYQGAHAEVMRQRRQWFEKFEGAYMALWWVEAGHLPTILEAKSRLQYLQQHGPSATAFTFKQLYAPPDQAHEAVTLTSFEPCPAT